MARRRIRGQHESVGLGAPMFIIGVLLCVWGFMGNDVMVGSEIENPSVSHGTRVKGFLKNGKRLPVKGDNFESFSRFASSFGRTCVNGQVKQAMLDSYAAVHKKEPKYIFVFGETGWCDGGSFWPHKTHQNGLSVDFIMPVLQSERVVPTPTTILDGFGYRNEFDEEGEMGDFIIDFDAMALHLDELRKAAKKNGLTVERVILAPELQKKLFKTKVGRKLKSRLTWSKKEAWVRHDDHYHVDFLVERALKPETKKDRGAPKKKAKKDTSKKAKK